MFGNNPLIYLAKKTWKYSAGNRHNVVLYVGLFALANAIEFFDPIYVAQAVNVIQWDIVHNGTLSWDGLIRACLWLSLLFLSVFPLWACHGPARVTEMTNAFLGRANYKSNLLRGIFDFPIQWHIEHHTGDTIDKVEKGTSALSRFAEDSFEFIAMIARLVGCFVVLIYLNPYSAYFVVLMAIIAAIVVIRFDKILVPQYKVLNRAENKISEKVIDAITNISTIVILRAEKPVLKAIDKKIMEPLELFKRNRKLGEYKWFIVNVISGLGMFWVLASYLYGHYHSHAPIMIGTFVALSGYIERFTGLFFRFAGSYSDIVRQRASIANAEEIANEFQAQEKTASAVLNGNWQKLEVGNLSFSYHGDNGADLHLEDVGLTIGRGERIALVGSTGSGKSTLLKVIRDLYTPRTLELCLDGKPVQDGFRAISSEIALIPQDPEIFSTTILENITLGVECNMESVVHYTDMACFTDVALSLPNKWESMIKEKGVNLSGGEKQRLALARGLMASEDKAIILLDEPTSSVDVINEQRIFENIFKAFTDKALICSLHSLHLLPLFDCIYLFDDGKIIASGTFSELLESSDDFKKLWEDFIKNRDREANRNGANGIKI